MAVRPLHNLVWVAAAALAFQACLLGRVTVTPIDRALPWLALVVSFVAWLVRDTPVFPAVQCAVPALIASAMTLPDERHRLLAYGGLVAAAFCGALLARDRFPAPAAIAARAHAAFAVAGVALLRWIARHDAEPVREILIAAGAVAIVLAFGRIASGAPAVMIAMSAAAITPGVPARTVALPFIVAAAVAVVRRPGRGRLDVVGGAALQRSGIAGLMALFPIALMSVAFPWSGAAARALPYFWRSRPAVDRHALNYALIPGQAIGIDVPPEARGLAVSVANGLNLSPGTVVGRIDPGGRLVRIGDVADWGYARREHIWRSKNALPRVPAGAIHGYGYDAWVDGAGWIEIPHVARIAVTADRTLRANVRLQVEALGVQRQ